MKIPLEELACFRPYKLQMYGASDFTTLRGIVEYEDCLDLHLKHPIFGNVTGDPIEHTPIVRPLSDINEAFPSVDIEQLMWLQKTQAIFINFNDSYMMINELFKKHLDVFNWIEKGLALNINKL